MPLHSVHPSHAGGVTARLLAVLAASVVLLAMLFAADAQAAKKKRPVGLPLSGIYESCVLPDRGQGEPRSCEARLRMIAEGGFGVVLNYNTGSFTIEEALEYAQLARGFGLRLAWNLGTPKVSLDVKAELIRATRGHPATWGYYIGDEVKPEDQGWVRDTSALVRSLTNRPMLYISRPRKDLLAPFKDVAQFAGPDVYPVGPFDPPVCPTARWASEMVGSSRLAMVLQAFSWSVDFPDFEPLWPSAQRMRDMRDAAIKCGRPKLLMWFCFHCIANWHPNPPEYFRAVSWAANGPMQKVSRRSAAQKCKPKRNLVRKARSKRAKRRLVQLAKRKVLRCKRQLKRHLKRQRRLRLSRA